MKPGRSYVRRALIALLLMGGVVGAGYGYKRYAATSEPKVTYQTVPVQHGKIVARVTATGTLSAHVTVLVGSQVSGRIQELFVDFNSSVKKGQLLARIDPQIVQAAVASARANQMAATGSLAKSQAQAANAELQYNRQKALVEKNLVAQADLDNAKAALDSAKADIKVQEGQLAQAEAQLHQAEVNLGYTRIVSPVDGVVISRSVDIGQTVAAALQAPTLFTIAQDLHQMQVDTNVAESDVGKLTAGMQATFKVDAYPNKTFAGKVREIRNAPQTIQSVVTYDAVIDVENPELELKPGMTANVTFVYAQRDDALEVANAALRFRPSPELLTAAGVSSAGRWPGAPGASGAPMGPGGAGRKRDDDAAPPDRRVVWALRAGALTRVKLKVGITDGSNTEVVESDLTESDQLVVDMNSGKSGPATAGSSRPPTPGGGMGRMF